MRQISSNGRATAKKSADPVAVLTSDIAAIKRDISHLIGAGAGAVTGKARETMSRLGEEAQELAGQAKERYEEAHETLAKTAAARPVATIAVSVAAGMILGKVLGMMMRRGSAD